jgi:acyl transferase domain-containing protein/NAD(P)H-dependent flavin oxidoreductase YrpB (nitropropane dioxygenase family)
LTHASLRDPRPRSFPSILGITPLEHPDARLVQALARADALGVLDLGRDAGAARAALAILSRDPPLAGYGVRVPEGVVWDPASLPPAARVVVLPAGAPVEPFRAHETRRAVIVQVTSLAEARAAVAAGARGLIVKGSESGGRVGDETAFVLLQRVVAEGLSIPVWVQGGIGLHSAAACIAGGAHGVVIDTQLALVRESQLPEPVKAALRAMDGSETTLVAGHRLYTRPDLPVARLSPETGAGAVLARLGGADLERSLLPAGQEAAFARTFADRFRTASGVVHALRRAVDDHLADARRLAPLGPGSPLAAEHGVRYPIAQGPMTRVSDRAAFADAVSRAGALPFLALSLMKGDEVRALLRETRALLGDRAWGVGILGFVPEDVRDEQLAVLRDLPPPAAIIAGGRPSQARPLDAQGTRTYLHVPSPGLLDLFLKDGARRFVFEGRECGGHVGPRSSFALWEAQIERLLAFEAPEELRVLFAGGVHDARSAAMVAALAAPLAARGAKIGVLMGTAYLFTEEAVASGAIQPGFQRAAVDCERTVLLETAPGHSTRCVESDYVRAFVAEKQRLEAEGRSAEEVWASLEQLNLGRLRIAAKGVRREGASLVHVGEDEQRREGMFMIGEVGALRGAVTTMAELHRDVSEGATVLLAGGGADAPDPEAPPPPADVAVVGIACIFPDAPDRRAYWANIVGGKSSISEVPPERWNPDAYFEPGGSGEKTPSKWGGFLPAVAFDPLAYGIPPRSLAAIEPVQLLALEVARRALADAGYEGRPFDRERTSVIFGAEAGTELSSAYGFRALYPQYAGPLPPALDAALPALTEDSFPGVLANVIAGRIANRLDLGGVNYTVDAACAASLAAVDLAVKELVSGASDMVLCGGADVHNSINDYLLFASVHALSPTGACRTFADDADGIALGEGVACVVLKRLADAERDGDRVYAVIKGIAGSSDGRHLGLTAPRKEGQMRALARAYRAAGVSPADVGLVEAHGTGTVVGDRTELGTLTDVYAGAGAQQGSVTLGSVKSQIGHTKCAAGLAGLIKAALALHHRVLPPTLHIKRTNPAYDAASSPFVFGDVARPWPVEDRRAAVSAFGFGGTNFHAVLAGYDAAGAPASGLDVWPAELFLFRGRDMAAALAQTDRLASILEADAEIPHADRRLADLARTVSERRGAVQIAVVAADPADLLEKLRVVRSLLPPAAGEGSPAKLPSGVFVRGDGDPGKIAFLFPGQGSQRVGMLGEIFIAFPRLMRFLALGEAWARRIFPPMASTPAERAAQAAALTDTRVAQPALGIAGLALADLLGALGVKADLAGGHSYGELVALAYAGVIPERDLLPMSAARGECILEAALGTAGADPGTMAAVTASVAEVERHLRGLDVVVANENAPDQTVISGPTAGVEAAVARLEAAGIAARSIPVACAFHSPLVAAAQARFASRMPSAFGVQRIPVWSNHTAQPYPAEESARVREHLLVQIESRVRFREEIESMYAAGARTFVEVGPGRVLTGLVGKILGARPHVAVACDRSGESGLHRLLLALAELAVAGVPVDAAPLFAGRDARVLDLDNPPSAGPPASAWMVNGHLARPLSGEIPPGALRPMPEPVTVFAAPPAGADESAVIEYLRTTRAIIEAQRQVMLGYLGHGGLPSADDLAPPVTLPAIPSLAPPRPRPSLAPARAAGPPSISPSRPRPSLRPVQAGPPSIAPRAARLPSESAAWMKEIEATAGVKEAAGPASVRDTLLEIVSERTGYPADMLDLDLNLEAELSIDSIKRIEILGTLGQRLGLDAELGDKRDRVIEQLATKKTLRGIVEWLETRKDAGVATTRSPEIARDANGNGAPHEPAAAPSGLRRYEIAVEDAPPGPPSPLAGKVFAIVPDAKGLAAEVAALLAERGAVARIAPADEPLEGVHGLVHLGAFAAEDPSAAAKDLFEAARRAIAAGASRLLAVTHLGAPFGVEADAPRAGVAGLLRSLAKEMPHLVVRSVALDPREETRALADRVAVELGTGGDAVEVGWIGAARRALSVVEAPRGPAASAPRIDASSVVLVTGGARGITALTALALARRTGCRLELVGRTPMPDRPEDPDLAAAPDLPALRRAILARGLPKGLGEVEALAASVMAARGIRSTLAAAEAAGVRVRYHALDVRDEAALGALIDALYTEHGRLDGVLHGAGVLEDKLFLHKTRESFDRVFDTKVSGARAIARHVRPDVRFVALFGSVAGAFGNRGQVDYAAANDALDKLAWWLTGRVRGRVVSMDWGPWGGTGMVSPELAREYARAGVGLVDPEAGAAACVDEILASGGPPQVVLMNAAAEVMLRRAPGEPAEDQGNARAAAPPEPAAAP